MLAMTFDVTVLPKLKLSVLRGGTGVVLETDLNELCTDPRSELSI
jgi:hypothetical protein